MILAMQNVCVSVCVCVSRAHTQRILGASKWNNSLSFANLGGCTRASMKGLELLDRFLRENFEISRGFKRDWAVFFILNE